MKKKIEIGIDRWIVIEHIDVDTWQVIESHRSHVQAEQGDLVRDTNAGWIVFRDINASIPKYRIPSSMKVTNLDWGEEE